MYQFKEIKIDDLTAKYSFHVQKKEWEEFLNKARSKLAKNVEVPGFRKGHVPMNLAIKSIKPEEIAREAAHKATDSAYAHIFENKNIKIQPADPRDLKLVVEKLAPTEYVFHFEFFIRPEVKVDGWKEIKIKNEKAEVLPKEIDQKRNVLINQHAQFHIIEDKEHKVNNGDIAVIDFKGSLAGKPFDGGESKNFPLTIGNGQFIPGFEENIIGMKVGDSKKITLPFPKDYPEASLAGQETVFEVTVNEIKQKEAPKFDDEFINKLNLKNIKTVSEWEKHTKEEILKTKEDSLLEQKEEEILNALITKFKFAISPVMIQREADMMYNSLLKQLEAQKIEEDKYFKLINQSKEDFKKKVKEDAENRIRIAFVLDAISRSEKIDADPKAYEAWVEKTAKNENMSIEEIKSKVPLSPEILTRLRNEITWEKIKKTFS